MYCETHRGERESKLTLNHCLESKSKKLLKTLLQIFWSTKSFVENYVMLLICKHSIKCTTILAIFCILSSNIDLFINWSRGLLAFSWHCAKERTEKNGILRSHIASKVLTSSYRDKDSLLRQYALESQKECNL